MSKKTNTSMKTKILAFTLALILCVSAFAGCAGESKLDESAVDKLLGVIFNAPDEEMLDDIEDFAEFLYSDEIDPEKEEKEILFIEYMESYLADTVNIDNVSEIAANEVVATHIFLKGVEGSSKLLEVKKEDEQEDSQLFEATVECKDIDGETEEIVFSGSVNFGEDKKVRSISLSNSSYKRFYNFFSKSLGKEAEDSEIDD